MVYSYLVEHDLGLAPNPFGNYCTLAVCKPNIRKSKQLQLGDWVIGTGAKGLEEATGRILRNKLIYAMEVCERVSFEEYWKDPRFQYKKPIMNSSLIAMFGDNFYHPDNEGNWIQEDSAHANLDGTVNLDHLNTDIRGENVLISTNFYYFGNSAPSIPKSMNEICHTGIGEKKLAAEQGQLVIEWLKKDFKPGRQGDPLNWQSYNQLHFF